jgi:hypothetical protein
MRISRIVLPVCICLVGLTLPVRSQKTNESTQHGIPGYLDARTGTFKPLANLAPPEESEIEALAPSSGDFAVTFTISIKSTIPSTDTITCFFNASVFTDASLRTLNDSMTVAATRSGSTATCKLKMFYSWPLTSPTTDLVSLDYVVSAGGTASTPFPNRESSQSLSSIKVPAVGATTTIDIPSTI